MEFLIVDIEDRHRCLRLIGSGFISLIISVCEKAWLSSFTKMCLLVMEALCFFLSSRWLYSFLTMLIIIIYNWQQISTVHWIASHSLPTRCKTRLFSIITVTNYLRKPNIIVIRGTINIWRIVSATAW